MVRTNNEALQSKLETAHATVNGLVQAAIGFHMALSAMPQHEIGQQPIKEFNYSGIASKAMGIQYSPPEDSVLRIETDTWATFPAGQAWHNKNNPNTIDQIIDRGTSMQVEYFCYDVALFCGKLLILESVNKSDQFEPEIEEISEIRAVILGERIQDRGDGGVSPCVIIPGLMLLNGDARITVQAT